MHADEVAIDTKLVARLVAAQFPKWAVLPLTPVSSSGMDNAMYRLGDELAVRLPRIAEVTGQVAKERLLAQPAPRLPLPIPIQVAQGAPGAEYPFPWSVVQWIDGQDAWHSPVADPGATARDLAAFVRALHAVEPVNVPLSGRSDPIGARDALVKAEIGLLRDLDDHTEATRGIDLDGLLAVWEASLSARPDTVEHTWIHGDLHATNLLVRDGTLCAVLDFGVGGLGDPGWDLLPAWAFLPAAVRDLYRHEVRADDGMWVRGKGLTASWAVIALRYYRHTNKVLATTARAAIEAVVHDW